MNSVLLFDDYARYLDKWLFHTNGTVLAAMTGVSFHAAKAYSRILNVVDQVLNTQQGKRVTIVEASKNSTLREEMEQLAKSHHDRRITLGMFVLGFKIMKICTLEMILESDLEEKNATALDCGQVFDAMEYVLTEAYHAIVVNSAQATILNNMKRIPTPKRDIRIIKKKDNALDPQLALTQAEFSVAKFIVDGMSTKEVAQKLNIAESTVHTHRKRIRNKLCIPGRQNLYTYLKIFEF